MKPGFYFALPAAQYHADRLADSPSISSSVAQILLRESPRKAFFCHPRLNPDFREEHDDRFDLGTAAHDALLTGAQSIAVIDPAQFPSKAGSIPDGWTNNAIRAARDAARAAGKTPILAKNYAEVRAMVEAAQAFLADCEITEYWNEADSEVTALWQEGSIWLRCRFDRLSKNHRCIIDYKTTESAAPEMFQRQIVRMGYHIQDAFYRRAIRAFGEKDPAFVFLAQSCEPPYECSLHGCDPAMREIADAEVDRAVQTWRMCLLSNKWPSHGKRIHWAMPSNWMIQDHEMRLMEAAA